MNVEIKYMRFEHRFGRLVAMAQLYEGDKLIHGDAPLSILLMYITQNQMTVLNAQQTLETLVVTGGFAS
jgi:hypothetical protein